MDYINVTQTFQINHTYILKIPRIYDMKKK